MNYNLLGKAIETIGQALRARKDHAEDYIKQAINDLEGILVEDKVLIKVTDKEADLSREIHTFLRKGEDSPAAFILYTLINKDQGINVWYEFVRLILTKVKPVRAMNAIEMIRIGCHNDNNWLMLNALESWIAEGGMVRFDEWQKGG